MRVPASLPRARSRALRRWRTWGAAVVLALGSAAVVPSGPADAATATLSTTNLAFGNVRVWTSKALVETVTVSKGYRVTSATHSPSGPFVATLGSNCGAPSLTLSTKCTVTDVYRPTEVAVSSASLRITVCPILGGTCTTYAAAAKGTGLFPATLSATTVAFGTHPAGVRQTKSLTVTPDTGRWVGDAGPIGHPPYLTPFAVAGFGSGCYQVGPKQCILTVTYDGNDVGLQTDGLAVHVCRSETDCVVTVVKLNGTSTAPATLAPTTIAFGTTVHVGATVTKPLTLKVLGDWIPWLIVGDGDPIRVGPIDECAGPGPKTCTLTATFRPTEVKASKATVHVEMCAPAPDWWTLPVACVSTNGSALSGTSVAPGSLSTTTLAMGTVPVGGRSQKTIAVKHDPGWYPVGGFLDPSSDFSSGECVTSASPCAFPVLFDPTRTGAQTDTLTIRLCNDDEGLCVPLPKVKVSGTGS